ncbi:hypothetical protein ACJMK2_032398, partial [Sinanodonta woodiana]
YRSEPRHSCTAASSNDRLDAPECRAQVFDDSSCGFRSLVDDNTNLLFVYT